MAAIEYGSYYWCVILNGKEQNVPGESVFLHADELALDPTGALIFKSAGRRPAGAEPQQNNGKNGDKNSAKNDQRGKDEEKDDKDSKDGGEDKEGSMIYLAFAPGSWRTGRQPTEIPDFPAWCLPIPGLKVIPLASKAAL